MTPQPLFLLSLPRSGSTLLQRMLATHPDIATASEPWILLPYLYALRPTGAFTEYGQVTSARAVADFCETLPGGPEDYLDSVRTSVLSLYERTAGDARYFLDKTPRYHLVVDELKAMFPDARFVFLWRQPLAVAASMIDSFGAGAWNLHRYSIDLHDGLLRLLSACDPDDPRCTAVRYEDVIADPRHVAGTLTRFLGLPEEARPDEFDSVPLNGRMGDRTGFVSYSAVSREPLDKWRSTMAGPLRRRWCMTYLRWVGRERLERMGYDFDELRRQVRALQVTENLDRLPSDVVRRAYGYGLRRVECRLMYPSAAGTAPAARRMVTPIPR